MNNTKVAQCLKSSTVLNLDKFSEKVNLNIQDGSSSYRTAKGSCLSLLATMIGLVFTIQNFQVLVKYDDTLFNSLTIRNNHDETYEFSAEQGFNLAFAIYDFGNFDIDMEEYIDVKLIQAKFN